MFSHFDTIPACDGQTDRKPVAKMCINMADACKKCFILVPVVCLSVFVNDKNDMSHQFRQKSPNFI